MIAAVAAKGGNASCWDELREQAQAAIAIAAKPATI
jgi:hypothetical protein